MKWGYETVPIGKLVNPIKKWDPHKSESNKTLTYIDIASVSRETKRIEEVSTINAHEAPSRARQLIKDSDVLVSTVRPNLNAVAQVESEHDGATASTGFCVLRPKPNSLDSRFLYYWVRTPYFVEDMTRQSTGASYPAVSDSIIKKHFIPLPPIEEQRRIAAILDKADGVRRKRKEAIALTEELLRSVFLDMFGDPVTNPKGWEVKPLGDLLRNIESGWSPKCEAREADPDEWGVLKLGAVTYGHFDFHANKAMLSENSPRPELEVKQGDLLVTRKNTYELVGASAFVQKTRPRLMLPDLIFRLKLTERIEPVYLWQTLSQKSMRFQLSGLAGGTAGSMPNISKARLRTLKLPVPPTELQSKYRAVANQFWLKKEHQENSQTSSDNLFNSLLQRAFRGEL